MARSCANRCVKNGLNLSWPSQWAASIAVSSMSHKCRLAARWCRSEGAAEEEPLSSSAAMSGLPACARDSLMRIIFKVTHCNGHELQGADHCIGVSSLLFSSMSHECCQKAGNPDGADEEEPVVASTQPMMQLFSLKHMHASLFMAITVGCLYYFHQ